MDSLDSNGEKKGWEGVAKKKATMLKTPVKIFEITFNV